MDLYDFSRALIITIKIIWSRLNVFLSKCSKTVGKIDERNQVLKLVLVAFDVNLIVF